MVKGNYSAFFFASRLIVLSFRPTGEIFKRWRMNKDLRFLATLGMTKDAE